MAQPDHIPHFALDVPNDPTVPADASVTVLRFSIASYRYLNKCVYTNIFIYIYIYTYTCVYAYARSFLAEGFPGVWVRG